MTMNLKIRNLLLLLFILLFTTGCIKEFPFDKDLTKKSYSLINQDSVNINFPENIKGKTTLIAFIYTHCPDICPMTTHNMQLAEEELNKEGIKDINYVIVSFDPDRDTPEVLKKFAEIRELDLKHWNLLTGKKEIITDLMRRFEVRAIPTDSSYSDDGELSYSIMHTDRISLIDKKSKLKKFYVGSTANIPQIVNDIKLLED